MKKKSMQKVLVCFSIRKGSILRFLVHIKNFGQYIKSPSDKLVKKKEHLANIS